MLTSSNPSPLGGSTSVDQIMKLATPSGTGGVRGIFSSLLAGADGRGEAGRRSAWASTVRTTTAISEVAKLAPRQRRTPPPNGTQVPGPGADSRNRSGRKVPGSG